MPSLRDSVSDQLGRGDVLATLAERIGGDKSQADAAAAVAVPALIDGLADRAATEDGMAAITDLLDQHNEGAGGTAVAPGDGGAAMVDVALGPDRASLTARLAEQAGTDPSTTGDALLMVAPVVVGELSRRRAAGGLDRAGLAALLESERSDGGKTMAASVGAGVAAGAGIAGAAVATVAASAVDGTGATKDADIATVGTNEESAVGGVEDNRNGGLGWLWWALGAVVLVLLLAWVLSTCSDTTDEEDGAAAVADDGDGDDAGGENADGAADESSDDDDSEQDPDSDDPDSDDTDSDDTDAEAGLAMVDEEDAEEGNGDAAAGDSDDESGEAAADDDVAAEDPDDADSADADPDGDAADTTPTSDEDADASAGQDVDEGDDGGDTRTINELLDLDPVTFRVSSATITSDGRAVLDEAAAYLTDNPDLEVEIGGHTDSDGSAEDNRLLSQRRADAVKAYLEIRGIDGARLQAVGYGEENPKVPNDSTQAKAANRRIEFTILS
ncbi:MAG: OmpA family protein [Actinomycetota bacterium]